MHVLILHFIRIAALELERIITTEHNVWAKCFSIVFGLIWMVFRLHNTYNNREREVR